MKRREAAARSPSNIAGVAQAADSTSRGAAETQSAAQLLVEMSKQLRSLVQQFKTGRRGAAGGRWRPADRSTLPSSRRRIGAGDSSSGTFWTDGKI